ncbi:unnamed protein product [Lathyrus oleraceus]
MVTTMVQENEEQCMSRLPIWKILALVFIGIEEDNEENQRIKVTCSGCVVALLMYLSRFNGHCVFLG